jgi:membrane protease YdiL (CAAX protease family)
MRFIDQARTGRGNAGTYILTIAIVFFAMIVGQLLAESICVSSLHYSLLRIPENADFNFILTLLLLPFVVAFFALLACVKFLHHQSVLTLFTGRDKFDWKRFFVGFVVWGAVMGVFLLLSILMGAPIEWNFNPSTFILLLLISIFILPIQTSMEEVFFRGYLLQGFSKTGFKPWIPILMTGLFFGLLHGANPEVSLLGYGILAYYIATGIFLGLLAHLDNGLELGLGYHAINNVFAALIVTNDWQAFHTDALFIDKSAPVFGWESLLTIFILQPILLFAFSKIYKWGDWKKKLFR